MKQIGKLVAVVGLVLGTAAGVAQTSAPVKDDLFTGTEIFAKGASDVTEITMDPASLDMVGGRRSANARSMVLNVVRTYTYDKPGMYRLEDVEAFRNKLNTGEWHCSVHTRSLKTGESTDICNKQRTDDLTETAIITVEPKSLTFIHTINHGGGWTPKGMLEGAPLVSLRELPTLAMLDMRSMPNVDVDVDLAVAKAMDAVRSQNWDAMQAKLAAGMKDLNKLDTAEMKKRMDEDMKRFKLDQQRMRDEMHPDAPEAAPKQPE